MKKKIVLLIITFVAIVARGEVNLFSYSADGKIISSKSFVDDFFWESGMPLVDTEDFLIKTTNGTEYGLKLKKISDPNTEGFFNVIQVMLKGNTLLTLKNIDVWEKTIYSNMNSYICVPLSPTSMALCFTGYFYDSTPRLFTIVVINKNDASLVFNRNCNILSYTNNSKEFSIVYSDQIQETNDDGSPYPATSQLKQWKIWKDGDMLKYAQIK